jgi:hypothetical protein
MKEYLKAKINLKKTVTARITETGIGASMTLTITRLELL